MSEREIAEPEQILHKSNKVNKNILDGLFISLSMAGFGFVLSVFLNRSFGIAFSPEYLLFIFPVISFLSCFFCVLRIFYLFRPNGFFGERESQARFKNFQMDNEKFKIDGEKIYRISREYLLLDRLASGFFASGVLWSIFLLAYK